MKLTAQLKLTPTPEQAQLLKQTLERANAACNYISNVAWERETLGKYALQKLCYQDVKASFKLSAQMVVRCLAKVGDVYTRDKRTERRFKRHGSIAYDERILSWNLHEPSVSIWTTGGREHIPVENIATDSDGNIRSSRTVNSVRHRHRRLRKKLQQKRTHSARRRLKKLSGKEQRFARDTNHVISRELVELAKRTKRAIALEESKGIRRRVRARRQQRARLSSWSFGHLRFFVEYKAQQAGVPVLFVDPRNTSRGCPECGHISRFNRPSQAVFKCVECGCAGHADSIAAGNIARRAEVMLPNVPDAVSHPHSVLPGASP